jgi:hypothetical protein
VLESWQMEKQMNDALTRAFRRLVLSSALLLFLELALIRWLGANVVHLSYFSNFVLLGSFLGAGLGFLRARSAKDRSGWWPVLLAGLVVVVIILPVGVIQASTQVIYFTAVRVTGPPAWVMLPLLFIGVAAVMAGLGEAVARQFVQLPALRAYRADLVGSLVGITAFSALSALRAPSVAWGVVVAVGAWLLADWKPSPAVAVSTLVLSGLLLLETVTPGVSWSPYYKVSTISKGTGSHELTSVSVNGIPHQSVTSIVDRLEAEPTYDTPYRRLPDVALDRVLIVGAGTGTDVALALRNGAKRVDAVEIDPRLRQLGSERNPDRPYADPRVHVRVTDGRAFLERTDQRWDLILFALPDSLTLVAGNSAIRLESYLFTSEAMHAVRKHLEPSGGFAMYNFYRQSWLVDRYAGTIAGAFGHPPCVDTQAGAGKQAVISVAVETSGMRCETTWSAPADVVAPATDDHPFPYLKHRTIPMLYLLVLAGVLLLSFLSVRVGAGGIRRLLPYSDAAAMGAAFLLLETRSITAFALWFGTTWVVNAIVFAGVLLAVLCAVEISRFTSRIPLPALYSALLVTLGIAWLVPAQSILGLPLLGRAVAAVAVSFSPILVANVIFARRLATAADSTGVFGANLLGAMVGGCLEYASLLIGLRGLLIVVAVLYAISALTWERGRSFATGQP